MGLYRLGDGCRIVHGFAFRGEHMSESTDANLPVVVNIGNFKYDGGFRFGSTRVQRYSGEYPESYRLAPGELLVVMTCQTAGGEILGIPGRIPNDGTTYLHNQRMGRVQVIRPNELSIEYLYYLFVWSKFNRHVFASASGSKILHTSPGRIEDFRWDRPPIEVQRRIGSILAAYDDLIENNTKRIGVLEEMARVFWSQWKSSVASSAPVGSLVRLVRDQVDPTSVDPETPYIGLEHIQRRSLDLSERGKASDAVSAKTAFVRWDIIFGKIRPYFHKVGPAAFDGISSNDAVVMRVRQEEDFSAVLMCVTSDEFVAEISQKANGSKMPRADWRDMAAYDAPCGSPEDRAALNRAVRPMVEMIQNLGERNRALRAARDLLLPKLLSGELSVDRIPDPAEVAP